MSAHVASPITIGDLEAVGRAGASAALIGTAMVFATVVSDYCEWALAGHSFLAPHVAGTLLGLTALLARGRRVACADVARDPATLRR